MWVEDLNTAKQPKSRNWPLITALVIASILAAFNIAMGYPLFWLSIQFAFNLALYWLIGFVIRTFWRAIYRSIRKSEQA